MSRRASLVVAAIVGLEAPQAIDRDGRVAGIQQVPQEFPTRDIERGNGSAEAVADQQVVAEEAEVLRRQGYTPGRAEPGTVLQMAYESSGGGEEGYEATFLAAI